MNYSKKSNGWKYWLVVVGLLLMVIAYFVHDRNRLEAEMKEADSVHYHNSVEILKENAMLHEKNDSLHDSQALLRKDVLSWVEHAANAWDKEKKGLLRQLAQVNTTRATAPELDSLQFALFGAPPDDSTHTIPLDYSRKLTGDALRLPIEQRIATRAGERLDSATSHYGRLKDSYELDIRTYKQDAAADHEAITGLMKNVGEMQGELDKANRKATRNVVISAGASATATQDGIKYGPSINIGYKIGSFRIGKRK